MRKEEHNRERQLQLFRKSLERFSCRVTDGTADSLNTARDVLNKTYRRTGTFRNGPHGHITVLRCVTWFISVPRSCECIDTKIDTSWACLTRSCPCEPGQKGSQRRPTIITSKNRTRRIGRLLAGSAQAPQCQSLGR